MRGSASGMSSAIKPGPSARPAAWLHQEAGRALGPGLIAEDIPEALPRILRRLARRYAASFGAAQ